MVSIIFLPILCIIYFRITNSFKKYTSIEINRPIICIDDQIHREFPFNQFPNKKCINYTIIGEDNKDSLTLETAKSKMNTIIQNKDNVTGIHFAFNGSSKYWTYIQALDICVSDTSITFLTKDNNIWVFYEHNPFTKQLPIPPMLDDMRVINKITLNDRIVNPIIEKLKFALPLALLFWPSILLFIAMIVMTYLYRVSLEKGSQ